MTSFVLLMVILALPPGEHLMGADGSELEAGIVHPYTEDGKKPFAFRSLDDCREKMVELAADMHAKSPETKFIVRCQPIPFYDGVSA